MDLRLDGHCHICGGPLKNRKQRAYCSAECRRRADNAFARARVKGDVNTTSVEAWHKLGAVGMVACLHYGMCRDVATLRTKEDVKRYVLAFFESPAGALLELLMPRRVLIDNIAEAWKTSRRRKWSFAQWQAQVPGEPDYKTQRKFKRLVEAAG